MENQVKMFHFPKPKNPGIISETKMKPCAVGAPRHLSRRGGRGSGENSPGTKKRACARLVFTWSNTIS